MWTAERRQFPFHVFCEIVKHRSICYIVLNNIFLAIRNEEG